MADLGTRTVPSFFIAYLHFRERAIAQGSLTGIHWNWDMVRPSLSLPGGPPGKPYYRPFLETGRGSSNWMNSNLAGSWNPSSTRSGQPARKVIQGDSPRGEAELRENHVQLAWEHLLGGNRVPAVSWAIWWLRDHAFTHVSVEQQPYLVVEAFREMFRFHRHGQETRDFAMLFDLPDADALPRQEWFEPGPEELQR